MKRLVWIALGAGLLGPGVSAAQLAPPQWRQPGVDSTHVLGNAVRVMPEYPVLPPAREDPAPLPGTPTPQTIQELLQAFDGVTLAMPGNETKGAHGQVRISITASKAQVQSTISWNWYDVCAATALSPSCSHESYGFHLSPEGLFAVTMGCASGYMGSAGGSAEFKWTDFVALGGLAGAPKIWSLQRSSLWSSCYASSGSND